MRYPLSALLRLVMCLVNHETEFHVTTQESYGDHKLTRRCFRQVVGLLEVVDAHLSDLLPRTTARPHLATAGDQLAIFETVFVLVGALG